MVHNARSRTVRSGRPHLFGVLPLDEARELGVEAVDLVQCRRVHLKTISALRIRRVGAIDLSDRNQCLSRGRVSDIRREVAYRFPDRGDGSTLGPSHFDVGFERKAEAAGALVGGHNTNAFSRIVRSAMPQACWPTSIAICAKSASNAATVSWLVNFVAVLAGCGAAEP